MKIQRLIAILTALLQTERISATQLAQKFDVSVRTIYRDVETLESAGIPIVTYTGVHGGIGILEQYKIDQKLFTDQDMTTLLTGLYSISGSISDARLNQTLEKIKALIPQAHYNAVELSSRQLYIDMTPWAKHPLLLQTMQTIQKALESNRVVTFGYTKNEQKTKHQRTVEPHQLVLKDNNWYLRAYCKQREAFRVFKLRRMRDVQVLGETFAPKPFQTKMADFKEWQHENMITVELVMEESLKEWMLDKCGEENMTPLENGKIHVRLPFVESELGYRYLLQQGHACECIAPEHVRREVLRRIDLMRAVYA